jgi:hypothetical protein
MRAGTGDLVGVQSFLGGAQRSAMTIVALIPTELAYIEREWRPPTAKDPLEVQLMPIVVAELTRRQKLVQDMARQQREVQERMRQLDRASMLGQLAAGVAHELNNALTVIGRGAEWIGAALSDELNGPKDKRRQIFELGLSLGRATSSADARRRTGELREQYDLSLADARRLAQSGLNDAALRPWKPVKKHVAEIVRLWETGATLNDLQTAADQAQHVVSSMRNLGRQVRRTEPVDVNETIRVALRILRNVTKEVQVELDLQQLPTIRANRGELVQIWTNLVKNACDALETICRDSDRPQTVSIRSWADNGELHVEVADNGPGVPAHMAEKIFEPTFTTKKTGLSFGLGLGLSIVQRLVTDYGGHIELRPSTPGATFRVTLPTEH